MPTKTKTKAKADKSVVLKTLVTFLLDRSYSMGSRRLATIEAYNGYVEGLRLGDTGEIDFTFIQFDTQEPVGLVFKNRPIKDVPLLNNDSYQPRGGTPLIDAAITTIEAIAVALTKRDDKPKVVVNIQTDGEENASTRSWEELRGLVKTKTEEGWQFNFMGAGIDAYDQGAKMGFSRDATVSYSDDLESTRAVFGASAMNTRGFADNLRANTSYTSAQKSASGDKYDRDVNVKPDDLLKKARPADLTAANGPPLSGVVTGRTAHLTPNVSRPPTILGVGSGVELDLSDVPQPPTQTIQSKPVINDPANPAFDLS